MQQKKQIQSIFRIFLCLVFLSMGQNFSIDRAFALTATLSPTSQASTCSVTYTSQNDWGSGATMNVVITNKSGSAINGWNLTFSFPGNQVITDAWGATFVQAGSNVTLTNVAYNAAIGANGGTASAGFNLNYSGSNAFPTSFKLNGALCGGNGPTNTPTTTLVGPTNTFTPSPTTITLPNLALNKPTTSSSNESASLASGLAVDGNAATRWSSAYSDPQWIQVDLGSFMLMNRFVLKWEAAYAKDYRVEVSNDGVNWTIVKSVVGNTSQTNDWQIGCGGRYVRIFGTARATTYGYSLYELEVYGNPGPTFTPTNTQPPTATFTPTVTPSITPTLAPNVNLAQNRPVTASSTESTSLSANLAVDANATTRWSSLYSDPQWIQVDLGSVQTIRRVVLRWEAAYGKSFQIQSSNDAVTWTSLYSTTTGAGGVNDVNVNGSGRYLRMYGTVRGTQYGYSLYEFEAYSVTGPTPTPTTVSSCNQSPADPQADARTRFLLCYLKTHTYISGQTDVADAVYVQNLTGRYPAIVAFDFYRYTDGDTSETQKAIDWAKTKKGIVAFQWHWKCPHGGEYYTDCGDFLPDLNNPNSKLYKDVDLVVRELKKMGDAGVPVLFRPLHEANNNYMWWTKRGSSAYIQLWRFIYQRAQAAGTHNLIWVFNGMASGQTTPMSQWYPGNDVVDVVSSDYFQSSSDYNTLKAIGNGNKVLAIAETMNQLNPANSAPWNFSVVWASRDWNGNSINDWKTAMANSLTISIDQLPEINAP